MMSMMFAILVATSAPDCANLSVVLSLGQKLVTKQHCKGVKACALAAEVGHPQTPAL